MTTRFWRAGGNPLTTDHSLRDPPPSSGTGTVVGPTTLATKTPIVYDTTVLTKQFVTFDAAANPADFRVDLGRSQGGGGACIVYRSGGNSVSQFRPLNADGSVGSPIATFTIPTGAPATFALEGGVFYVKVGATTIFDSSASGYNGTAFHSMGTYLRVHNEYFGDYGITAITGLSYGTYA